MCKDTVTCNSTQQQEQQQQQQQEKQQQYYFKAKHMHKGEDNQSQLSFNKDNVILYHSCNVNNDAWLLGSFHYIMMILIVTIIN